MKRCITIITAIIFCNITLFSSSLKKTYYKGYTLEEIIALGLPVMVVETVNGEEPVAENVLAPEGCIGQSTRNQTRVPGRLVMIEKGDTVYDSGEYIDDVSGMTIRIRGNSTGYAYLKKPYKIKLQKKADLLNRGDDDKYKDKHWVITHDEFNDLATICGNKINELMGLQWTPEMKFINLFMNGEYRGYYFLTESVRRNTRCRLNVDKDGMIFEYDPYWWNEDFYINSSYVQNYTFKYPDEEDIKEEDSLYYCSIIQQFENAVRNNDIEDIIDINSFASWILAQDILGNRDNAGSNIFLTKYDRSNDSKIMMGNMWDYAVIFKMKNSWANIHSVKDFVFCDLFDNNCMPFINSYKAKWDEVSGNIFEEMTEFINKYTESEEYQGLLNSRYANARRWDNYDRVSMDDEVNEALEWFSTRKSFLDPAIDDLYQKAKINTPIYQKTYKGKSYNLYGIPAGENDRIIITNKKKYIIR